VSWTHWVAMDGSKCDVDKTLEIDIKDSFNLSAWNWMCIWVWVLVSSYYCKEVMKVQVRLMPRTLSYVAVILYRVLNLDVHSTSELCKVDGVINGVLEWEIR